MKINSARFYLAPGLRVFHLSVPSEQLLSVAVTDQQAKGLSAIYTFFEPNEDKRSLGVLSIPANRGVSFVELAVSLFGLLGERGKMAYKTDYRPAEFFVDNKWIRQP